MVHSADGTPSSKTKNTSLNAGLRELLNRINLSDPSALEDLPTLPQVPELNLCPTLENVRVARQNPEEQESSW